jgi:DNA-binding CsgD family transcriptional regulator
MVEILLRFKSRLMAEALANFLMQKLMEKGNIDMEPQKEKTYEIVIFDKPSLKEHSPEDFAASKKLLIDTDCLEQECLFLFIYYKLSGIFSADCPPDLIVKCLEVLQKGEIWISKNLIKNLSEEYGFMGRRLDNQFIPDLTIREKVIVKLGCEGLTNKEIAERLSISEQTVKAHINKIFKKTGVNNRQQLLKNFNNILFPEPSREDRAPRKKTILKIKKQV